MIDFGEYFRRSPFVRLLIPLIIGIILALKIPFIAVPDIRWLMFAGLLFVFVILFLQKSSSRKTTILIGVIINLFFVLLGIVLVQFKVKEDKEASILFSSSAIVTEVIDLPVEKAKTYRLLLRTVGIRGENEWSQEKLKVLAYIEKSEKVSQLIPGDKIIIQAKLNKFKTAGNPGEFDYPRYMSDRKIFGSVYVEEDNWQKLSETNKYSFSLLPVIWRNRAFQYLKGSLGNTDALALISALLLGERDYIDEEIKNSFANAGVIHIMAVSGLHVGIIYIVLYYLLFFLDKIKHGKKLKMLLIIVLLWLYAFITGLSPSVLRAVTMFSFVAIGQGLKRPTSIYNSLAISAFFLLCINPYFIRDLGFQLSFSAVLGIVFLYPKIYPFLSSRYWLFDKIWMLMVVSFSAQLATFPLVVYYFHQFPTYFLLTNLLAIPMVTIIIYLGLLLLIFSFSSFLAAIFSFLLTHLVNGLIFVVQSINNFPLAVIKPIFLDRPGSILLYLILFSIILFLVLKRGKYFNYSLFIILVFLSWNLIRNFKAENQRFFSVFNVNEISALQFIDGKKAVLYTGAESDSSRAKVVYALEGFWHKMRIKEIQWRALNEISGYSLKNDVLCVKNNHFQFYNIKGLFLDENFPIQKNVSSVKTDLAIMAGSKLLPLQRIKGIFAPDLLVVDSSVPRYFTNLISSKCEQLDMNCYLVGSQGAFVLSLE